MKNDRITIVILVSALGGLSDLLVAAGARAAGKNSRVYISCIDLERNKFFVYRFNKRYRDRPPQKIC
jgi:hypothetical protein